MLFSYLPARTHTTVLSHRLPVVPLCWCSTNQTPWRWRHHLVIRALVQPQHFISLLTPFQAREIACTTLNHSGPHAHVLFADVKYHLCVFLPCLPQPRGGGTVVKLSVAPPNFVYLPAFLVDPMLDRAQPSQDVTSNNVAVAGSCIFPRILLSFRLTWKLPAPTSTYFSFQILPFFAGYHVFVRSPRPDV